MVNDPIKHKLVATFQFLYILPCSQARIHGFKVNNREPSVRRVREEGQDMQCIDVSLKVGITEF